MKRIYIVITVLTLAALACGATATPTANTPEAKAPNHIVTSNKMVVCNTGGVGLTIRSAAGTEFNRVGELQDGDAVETIGVAVVNSRMELWQEVKGGWARTLYLCPVE